MDAEALFLDRRILESLRERESFRLWVVDQFVSGQLERKGALSYESIDAQRVRELDESERERIMRELEFHKTIAVEYEKASGKKKKKETGSSEGRKLLSFLRNKREGELGKYVSE